MVSGWQLWWRPRARGSMPVRPADSRDISLRSQSWEEQPASPFPRTLDRKLCVHSSVSAPISSTRKVFTWKVSKVCVILQHTNCPSSEFYFVSMVKENGQDVLGLKYTSPQKNFCILIMAGRPKNTYYIYLNFELDLSVQFNIIGLIRSSCCNVFVQYLVGGYCMPKKYSPFFASLYINVLGLRCSILFISNQLDKDAYHIQYSSVQFSIYILKRSRVHTNWNNCNILHATTTPGPLELTFDPGFSQYSS